MRGLDAEERAVLERWLACAPCADGVCPSVMADPSSVGVGHRLRARGVIDFVDCSADADCYHMRPNAMARVALVADAAARGPLVSL